jgi:hypothetical protein
MSYPATDFYSAEEQNASNNVSHMSQKNEDGEFLSKEPSFHFSVGKGFQAREIDRQSTPAAEVKFVSVEYSTVYDEEFEASDDQSYFQLKPQLSIAIYELESDLAVYSKIEELANGEPTRLITIGANVYLQADLAGLVPETIYFLVDEQTLYAFIMTNVPSSYADDEIKKSADFGFWQVLETFKVE